MVDKYDKSLEGLFTGESIKYTLVSNKVKRSDFGTGYNVFEKLIEYKGEFCFVPSKNEGLKSAQNLYLKKISFSIIVRLYKIGIEDKI